MGNELNYSQKQVNALIKKVYNGEVSPTDLPEDLYFALSSVFKSALYKGFDGKPNQFEFGTPDAELLSDLRENIYMFSAAKTFQQVKEMSGALVQEGQVATFQQFKEKATEIFDTYNKTWLQTEYDTAIGMAQSARKWSDIQQKKEIFPYLQYNAVMDENTEEECAALNGFVLSVDDGFWDEHMPPLHWNCRCLVEQVDKYEDVEITPQDDVEEALKNVDMQPIFKMNPGKDKVIFSDEHPYFDVSKGEKGFAETNFGLPIPEPENTMPETVKEASKQIGETIQHAYGLNIAKVEYSKALSLETSIQMAGQVNALTSEYNIASIYDKSTEVALKFKSGARYYGRITIFPDGKRLGEINFGHVAGDMRYKKFDPLKLPFNSRVDEKNNVIATLTHEFGHLITTEGQASKDSKLLEFWKELRTIKSEYSHELKNISNLPDGDLSKVFLGRYASTNANEFMAEAFTEYKLSSEPTKYAKIVGKLIDKYFKK